MVALITGVANENSIAAYVLRELYGEEPIIATYLDERTKKYAWPAIKDYVDPEDYLPLDMRKPEELEAVVRHIENKYGEVTFVLHSMAFARASDLNGRVIDSSLEGLQEAVDISCHSLCRLAKAVEPTMYSGGSIVTLSYLGGERVVPGYNIMGPCKAMLESMVRWLAYELGPKRVRVNAVSPGPVATRAASGISGFQGIVDRNRNAAPAGLTDLCSIAQTIHSLGYYSPGITGQVIYVDGGYSVMAA